MNVKRALFWGETHIVVALLNIVTLLNVME